MAKQSDGTYTRDFPNGAWVTATAVGGVEQLEGFVTALDADDGQYSIDHPSDPGEPDSAWESDWCEHDSLQPAQLPTWLATTLNLSPEHVFIVDWHADGTPGFRVYANPESVLEGLDELLPVDTPENLQLKLMEAVADPGDRFEVSDGYHVTFASVIGGERT